MTENNTNHITPIFRDFLQSYSEKDVGVTDQEWLRGMLKEKELEITDEELSAERRKLETLKNGK